MIVFYSYMAWDGGDWTAAGVFSGKFSIFDNSKLPGGGDPLVYLGRGLRLRV
jgi:hypothetical protein